MQRLSLRFHVDPFLLALFFLGVLIVSSAAIGWLVNNVATIQAFDRYFYEVILNGPHPVWLDMLVAPFNFNFIPFVPSFFLSFLLILILLCLGVVFFRKRNDFGWALLAMGITVLVDQTIARAIPIIIFRQRPFTALPNHISQVMIDAWKVWPSFPSGHVRDTALFMTVLAAFMPKRLRWSMAVFSVFIAWSRIYLGAHYPTDVIAGLIIGYLLGKIVLGVVEEIRKLREVQKQKKNEVVQQTAV